MDGFEVCRSILRFQIAPALEGTFRRWFDRNQLRVEDQLAGLSATAVSDLSHFENGLAHLDQAQQALPDAAGDRAGVLALLGPLLLLIAMGYGMSFDVENIDYAVLDYDRTPASRAYLEQFDGSRYFRRTADLGSDDELWQRLIAGDLRLDSHIRAI